MRTWVHAALCGLVGTVLILGAATARAADDDDNEKSFDKKIRDNLMGALGIKGGPDIDYRERSPLVLPPRIDLPPPQANATTNAPNWPVDADQKRKREETSRRRDEVEESRPLRPSELNVGAAQRSSTPGANAAEIDGRNRQDTTGSLFSNMFSGGKQEGAKFTQEPARTTLTEPPVGYQTPSPDQPYTAKGERLLPAVPSFFDFGTGTK
jgi:hypothetical protein